MNFSAPLLHLLAPRCDSETWTPALAGAMEEFYIVGDNRTAAFLAQLCHESSEFTHLIENLNYSADRLVQVWPKRFTGALAATYARKPEAIANYVYAGRNGNGAEATGDGWAYRGRGPIQLTGRGNYAAAGGALGVPLETEPDTALTPKVGARIAGWFWDTHKCNDLADAGDFTAITKAINGGTVGLAERRVYFDHALALLRSIP